MDPVYSVIISSVLLISGIIAVVAMMNRMGRPQNPPTPSQIWLHRVSGWVFVACLLINFTWMFGRFYVYWEEDSARTVLHYTSAFLLLVLLVFKISIVRFYPGFRKHLFLLGATAFCVAFLLIAGVTSRYLVRITHSAPYISHSVVFTTPNKEVGKQLFIEHCRTCHVLDNILTPRSAKEWEKVVRDMALIAWPRIRPDVAKQIFFYLSQERVPKTAVIGTGYPLIDEHCLPCHEADEILKKKKSREEWEITILKMSNTSPETVPIALHRSILEAIMEAQARQEKGTDAAKKSMLLPAK